MFMKKFKTIYWLIVVAVISFLAGCENQPGHMSATSVPSSFSSNGERIYFTGTSSRNSPIQSDGGWSHMQMMGGACASCHGSDRRGGARMFPYFWIKTPPLLAKSLFGNHDDIGNGHGDHESYDEVTIRKAISKGIDPSGKSLSDLMPRWRMSDADMSDLVAYLKN